MSTYDKLVDLITDAENDFYGKTPHATDEARIARVVDHLISHGVTVKEMQKPIAIEELKILGVYWLEERGDKLMPCEIGRFSCAHYTEINIIGWATPDELKNNEYGKTWRCWAEKPTEEEKKAAEWLI